MWFNLAVSVVLTALEEAFKNPTKKAALRAKMLTIRNQIDAVYPPESGVR
jgi:hypothetical protein